MLVYLLKPAWSKSLRLWSLPHQRLVQMIHHLAQLGPDNNHNWPAWSLTHNHLPSETCHVCGAAQQHLDYWEISMFYPLFYMIYVSS